MRVHEVNEYRRSLTLVAVAVEKIVVGVTAVMRDVTHSLARSREALRVKKYMCSIEVENRFNARLTSSFIL